MPAVKTAISIQKPLYDEMDRLSRKMHIPRSRLFARAVEEFIGRRKSEELTRKINETLNDETPAEKGFRGEAMTEMRKLIEGTW